jgi:hypothetical protein
VNAASHLQFPPTQSPPRLQSSAVWHSVGTGVGTTGGGEGGGFGVALPNPDRHPSEWSCFMLIEALIKQFLLELGGLALSVQPTHPGVASQVWQQRVTLRVGS